METKKENSFQAENMDKMMQTNERAKVRNRIQAKRGEDMELRETILEGTIQAFNKKGLKFTMDDIASLLGMSKKTIYTVFQDKNTLVSEMVDYCFDSIKESEQEVTLGYFARYGWKNPGGFGSTPGEL